MLLFSVRLGIIQNAKPQVLMLILKLNYYKYFFSVAFAKYTPVLLFSLKQRGQISLQLNALKLSSYKNYCTVHLPKPNSRLLIQSSRIQTR